MLDRIASLLDDAKYILLHQQRDAVEMKEAGFWHSRSSHQWEGMGLSLPPLDRRGARGLKGHLGDLGGGG